MPGEDELDRRLANGFDDVEIFFAGNSEDSLNPLVFEGGDQKIRAFDCLPLACVHLELLPNVAEKSRPQQNCRGHADRGKRTSKRQDQGPSRFLRDCKEAISITSPVIATTNTGSIAASPVLLSSGNRKNARIRRARTSAAKSLNPTLAFSRVAARSQPWSDSYFRPDVAFQLRPGNTYHRAIDDSGQTRCYDGGLRASNFGRRRGPQGDPGYAVS